VELRISGRAVKDGKKKGLGTNTGKKFPKKSAWGKTTQKRKKKREGRPRVRLVTRRETGGTERTAFLGREKKKEFQVEKGGGKLEKNKYREKG